GPSAASGSSSPPSRATSAAWPLFLAASSADTKFVRQSARRCRSSPVATSFHAVVQRGISPEGCSSTLHEEQPSKAAARNAARIGRSLGSCPAAVHAEVRSRDRRRLFTAQEER